MDQSSIDRNGLPPLLEIKLTLYQLEPNKHELLFNAEETSTTAEAASTQTQTAATTTQGQSQGQTLETKAGVQEEEKEKKRKDVWQVVTAWVDKFFEVGKIMQRMDGKSYVDSIKNDDVIVKLAASLQKHLNQNQKACEGWSFFLAIFEFLTIPCCFCYLPTDYRADFAKYEFLWKKDRNAEFQSFLQSSLAERKQKEEEAERKKREASKAAFGARAQQQQQQQQEQKSADEENQAEGAATGHSPAETINEIMPLDKFEQKIQYFQQLAQDIKDKKAVIEIGWLKINASPIKLAIQSWINK